MRKSLRMKNKMEGHQFFFLVQILKMKRSVSKRKVTRNPSLFKTDKKI